MKNQEIKTFMTYEDWKKLYKHNLKKYLKNKIKYCLQWLLFGLFMAAVPVGMVTHWLLFGY